jgi:Co/Zn/Cd efflux system component
LRGVVSYTVPKFWLDDTGAVSSGHSHSHGEHHHGTPLKVLTPASVSRRLYSVSAGIVSSSVLAVLLTNFLHILADTLGSVAVVISTILVHYSGWAGYDPLAY